MAAKSFKYTSHWNQYDFEIKIVTCGVFWYSFIGKINNKYIKHGPIQSPNKKCDVDMLSKRIIFEDRMLDFNKEQLTTFFSHGVMNI